MDNKQQKQGRAGWSCTTMIVGKQATVDGSVIVSHSDDDVTDERLIYVPAADYPSGSTRPVYYDDCSLGHNDKYNLTEVRRYVGTSRGPGYNTNDFPSSKPLGEIPQCDHTYAYFDSCYGVMNEHQLMIGECTCGAKYHPDPVPDKLIFYSAELSRVALERCTKAVDAVRLIGSLIEEYGYYGTGETLLIGDPNEAWVMEMCGFEGAVGSKYDSNKTGGLWVAQRVPDDEFFVAANEFRIRTVVEGRDRDSENMKYSANLFTVCKQQGWLPSYATEMDWLPTVSFGEYFHPYYSLRRVWRVLTKVAPSQNFPAWVENGFTTAYPFSIKPEHKLSVADVMALYRDYYEGTEFDLTKGRAAGPFGDPTRYENNPDKNVDTFNLNVYHPKGAWERSLSIFRCGMTWINQARSFFPDPIGGICWISLDRPASTCLMPFYVGVNQLYQPVQTMNLLEFSRDSAWWAFNLVANYATIKYAFMIQDIQAKQKELENAAYQLLADFESSGAKSRAELTALCNSNAEKIVSEWWRLFEALVVKYNDGCTTTADGIMQKVNYPTPWLEDVGYYNGPVSYQKKK